MLRTRQKDEKEKRGDEKSLRPKTLSSARRGWGFSEKEGKKEKKKKKCGSDTAIPQ